MCVYNINYHIFILIVFGKFILFFSHLLMYYFIYQIIFSITNNYIIRHLLKIKMINV